MEFISIFWSTHKVVSAMNYCQRNIFDFVSIIDNVIINRDKESTSSSDLKVVLTIDGFYL